MRHESPEPDRQLAKNQCSGCLVPCGASVLSSQRWWKPRGPGMGRFRYSGGYGGDMYEGCGDLSNAVDSLAGHRSHSFIKQLMHVDFL